MAFRSSPRQSFQAVFPSQPPYQLLGIIIQHKKFNTLKILDEFVMLIIEHTFLKQIFVCDNYGIVRVNKNLISFVIGYNGKIHAPYQKPANFVIKFLAWRRLPRSKFKGNVNNSSNSGLNVFSV